MPQNADGIAAVLLAAGGGARLGGGKLLLPWRGRPLIAHQIHTVSRATGLLSLTVVLGHDADAVRQAVSEAISGAVPVPPFPIQCMLNQRWMEGMSASLRCGLESLLAGADAGKVRAAMFLLADQPLVTTRTLNILIRAHTAAWAKNPEHPATAPVYLEKRGNPAIISRNLFPDITTLQGDTGARRIMETLGGELLRVSVDDPGVLHDVDTPEAYEALLAHDGTPT